MVCKVSEVIWSKQDKKEQTILYTFTLARISITSSNFGFNALYSGGAYYMNRAKCDTSMKFGRDG